MPVNLSPRKSKQKMQKENILEANLRNLKFNAVAFDANYLTQIFKGVHPLLNIIEISIKMPLKEIRFLHLSFAGTCEMT